jgi:hypothetical protein
MQIRRAVLPPRALAVRPRSGSSVGFCRYREVIHTMRNRATALILAILLAPAMIRPRPVHAAPLEPATTLPDQATLAAAAAKRFPQPVTAGSLLHKKVIAPLESQPLLGTVRDIVRASDGAISVIVDYGGFLGFGTHPIAVPPDAMVLVGNVMEIVGYTQAQLNTLPVYAPQPGATPVPPETILKIGLAKPSH